MFKLIKLNDGLYTIVGSVMYEGDELEIMKKMVRLGISEDDMVLGLQALDAGDDYAEYGVLGKFIFSSKFNKKES